MTDGKRETGETGEGREQRERSAGNGSVEQREQPSALGSDVATRSSTRPTPDDEKAS